MIRATIIATLTMGLFSGVAQAQGKADYDYDADGWPRAEAMYAKTTEELAENPCYRHYRDKEWDAMRARCYDDLLDPALAAAAHYALSVVKRHGLGGFERNVAWASYHLREATLLGLQNALYVYANVLVRGEGTPRDHRLALDLLYESSRAGSKGAMFYMADLYMRGFGAPKNRMAAMMWVRIAEAAGIDPRVVKSYNRFLPTVISEEEIHTAEMLAKGWILANPEAFRKEPPKNLDALPDFPWKGMGPPTQEALAAGVEAARNRNKDEDVEEG